MENKRLFGTDGIRGKYGETLTGDTAYRLGNALARKGRGEIVVGRDTRQSGGELYKYLRKGILDAGGDIVYLGIVPTPVVAYVTSQLKAMYGVVITASHNPPEYNGLKVFSTQGMKIGDAEERTLEEDMREKIFVANTRGTERYEEEYIQGYKNRLKEAFLGISGLNITLDVGNGALSTIAGEVYREIIPTTHIINDEGNGALVNVRSGALHVEGLIDAMRRNDSCMGFAFDGDGDRITAVTHEGKVLNGDRLLYAIACYMHKNGTLTNNVIVGTPYTNMGVERDLARHGIALERSDVGDSNVAISMSITHASVGGERAGHIIMSQYGMTGDALLVSLYLTKMVTETGLSLDKLCSCHEYPTVSGDFYSDCAMELVEESREDIERVRQSLGTLGRVIVRASGTEPKVRVMVEAEDEELARTTLDMLLTNLKDKKI